MAGIASAAIIGGLGLAGSLGAGLIGSKGAGAAGAQAQAAGQQAYNAGQAQIDRNTSNASPYTSGGVSALSQIGALLGYGNLTNPGGEGATYNFNGDPNAQGNAITQLQGFANASGARQPTLSNAVFTPQPQSNAVSQTFQADPSYAWRLGQGIQAQDQSAAAKGTLLSGAQQQALTNYGQNAASQGYADWYNRLNQQNQYNLAADQYNTQGGLATNAQNFGQEQTLYGNEQGQWNNALGLVSNLYSGGNSATGALDSANSGATQYGGNALVNAGNAAAGYTAGGANDIASSVGSGVNNALQAYILRNAFGNNGGGGSTSYIPSPSGQGNQAPLSIGGQPQSYYTGY